MAALPLSGERFQRLIGLLLRAGVLLAATVVLAGGLIYLTRYGALKPQYEVYRGEPLALRQASTILGNALSGGAHELIQLGLLILIATPIARVAFSVVAFGFERDWLYVAATGIVLAVLLYSLTST